MWFIYDTVQTQNTNIMILPTWVDEKGVVSNFEKEFPDVTFVESMYSEVRDEIMELGYNLNLDQLEGGLWDYNNDHQRPLIVGFEKGWKKTDSIHKCYCAETIVEIIFELYPEKLDDYLNQPV